MGNCFGVEPDASTANDLVNKRAFKYFSTNLYIGAEKGTTVTGCTEKTRRGNVATR